MNIFSNDSIESGSLPLAEEIKLQPIEQSYWKVQRLEWIITWGIILTAAIVTLLLISPFQFFLWIIVLVPLLLFSMMFYWLFRKSFSSKAYALRERDLIYRRGWLFQRTSICPFNRIQHCSVNSGPFERKLGLASLSVYTAGTEGADLKIPGLKEETAHNLRDFIMKKTSSDEIPGN